MKTFLKYVSIIIITFLLTSCEDKVNIDLNTAAPKLVIDAALKWQKGTTGSQQTIKLTTTTDYYNPTIPAASGATVLVTNSAGTAFVFTETPNTGEYICTSFAPVINDNYTLSVTYNGQNYTATEKLLATPTIDSVDQRTVPGFGSDQIQIKFFYQDNGLETNFYLIGFKNSTKALPEFGVIRDRFFQGNQMFGFYTDDKLKTGDGLLMGVQGISERYFNYLEKMLSITGGNGGPFSTPPATLRGNVINQTNNDNYPLGYFSLGETDSLNYVVQ
jgi:hypothetical protein